MKKDISYLQLYEEDNRCPLARHFKARIHETKFKRMDKDINSSGLCKIVKFSCCEESGFITMRDNWKMNSINTGITYRTVGNIYKFFFTKMAKL